MSCEPPEIIDIDFVLAALCEGTSVTNVIPPVFTTVEYLAETAETLLSLKFSFQMTAGSAPMPISPGYFAASVVVAAVTVTAAFCDAEPPLPVQVKE